MKAFTRIGLLLAGIWGVVGQPAAAQGSTRAPCRAAIRGQPAVCIATPRDGVTLTESSVRVVLTAVGISIAAADAGKAGAAHYHLFLDVDPSPTGEAIPQGPGVTHLGGRQKDFTFDNLAPGMHRLIVLLGDNAHVALPRQQGDTSYFAVARRL